MGYGQSGPINFGMPDYSKRFGDMTQPIVDQTKLQTGRILQQSNDPLTKILGQTLSNDTSSIQASTNIQADLASSLKSSILNEEDVGEKKSFSEKFNDSTFGKHFTAWNTGLDATNSLLAGIASNKMFGGTYGNLTQTLDSGWNTIANNAPPQIQLMMKALSALNKGANLALGKKALDNETSVDALLNNPLTGWNLGVINAIGGENAETIVKDTRTQEEVGADYLGAFGKVDRAVEHSGKRYGLFSSGALKDINKSILEARREQDIMSDIASEARDRFSIRNSMASINGNRRRFNLQGGYDQTAVRMGRYGMPIQDLQRAKRISSATKYQKGGKVIDPFESYLQTLPENQKDSTQFRVKDYWEFNGKPKDFDEAVFRGMFTQFEDGWHANSVAENPKTGEIEFMKSSSHPSIQRELDWYESDDASEFRSQYELQKTEPYFKYVKRKGSDSPQSFKEGGNLTKSDWLVEVDINNISLEFRGADIEEVDIDNILPEFKEGGKFNLIPEGALHARKHNMDVEGITPKGIPVVSHSEGGEIEQQAEIEREEIIFRLEVTKKLEELAKDGSDEAAIEAGKLLVEEILYNTIDNTNSLI